RTVLVTSPPRPRRAPSPAAPPSTEALAKNSTTATVRPTPTSCSTLSRTARPRSTSPDFGTIPDETTYRPFRGCGRADPRPPSGQPASATPTPQRRPRPPRPYAPVARGVLPTPGDGSSTTATPAHGDQMRVVTSNPMVK